VFIKVQQSHLSLVSNLQQATRYTTLSSHLDTILQCP